MGRGPAWHRAARCAARTYTHVCMPRAPAAGSARKFKKGLNRDSAYTPVVLLQLLDVECEQCSAYKQPRCSLLSLLVAKHTQRICNGG